VSVVSAASIKASLDKNITSSLKNFCADYGMGASELDDGDALEFLKRVARLLQRRG